MWLRLLRMRMPSNSRIQRNLRDVGRALCTSTTSTAVKTSTAVHIGQGGHLSICMAKATGRIKLTTQWKDSCDIAVSRLPAGSTGGDDDDGNTEKESEMTSLNADRVGLSLKVDEVLQEISLVHDEEWATPGDSGTYLVEAIVPELFSIDLTLGNGSISVLHKMKGDCRIVLDMGDIDVGVIRGEDIELSTGSGGVNADELEGKVAIAATKVCARLINGAEVGIDATGEEPSVKIGGLYSSAAQIRSAGDVAVSACHGRLKVHTAGDMGAVTLSSVNGMAHVSTGEGGAQVHVDALEEGTSSYIRSDEGDILVSMSQDVNADMIITGNIDELPASFEGDVEATKAIGTINCPETRSSQGVRGVEYGVQDSGQGKIDLTGARNQSLRQFFPNDVGNNARPRLSVSAVKGSVGLETLSWAENIARKFTQEQSILEK